MIFIIRKGKKCADLNLFVAVFVNYDNALPLKKCVNIVNIYINYKYTIEYSFNKKLKK